MKGIEDVLKEVTEDKVTSSQDECWEVKRRKMQEQDERFWELLEEEVPSRTVLIRRQHPKQMGVGSSL